MFHLGYVSPASSHRLLQLDWIFLDHHLLLNTRQNPNNLHLHLLFKSLVKHVEILDYYLGSFLSCKRM